MAKPSDVQDEFARGAKLIADALTERFGELCDTFDDTCPTCRAWMTYGVMVGSVLRRINGHDEISEKEGAE